MSLKQAPEKVVNPLLSKSDFLKRASYRLEVTMRLIPWIVAAVSAGLIVHILQAKQAKKQRNTYLDSARPAVPESASGISNKVPSHHDSSRLEVDEIIHQLADEITVVGGRTAQIVQHEIDELER
jgi:hypothetical protein